MAANNRYIEVSRIRGVVTISTVLRFPDAAPLTLISLRDVINKLPVEWDVDDGDVIRFREVR